MIPTPVGNQLVNGSVSAITGMVPFRHALRPVLACHDFVLFLKII